MDYSNNYAHKKFNAAKRKHCQTEDDDVIFVMEQPAVPTTVLALSQTVKRPRITSFFRPWLDQPAKHKNANGKAAVQQVLKLSSKPKQRRQRYKPTNVDKLRPVQMEQQYFEYQQQHEAMLEQQLRLSLYCRELLLKQLVISVQPTPISAEQQAQQLWLAKLRESQQLLTNMQR